MSNSNVPNWPARTGFAGFLIWGAVVVSIVATGGFIYMVITGS